jgi:zona occludens toxin
MPINFVTGLPRQGKTLFTFVQVRERSQKENRPVYYCNIPGVTLPGWTEIDHPDKWVDCPNDSIIVVDELQDFWGMASSGARVPFPILELSKHGKRGIDFYFITQDPTLVHQTPRKLCETHWHVVRAFGSENAVAHKFNRMQTDPEKVKGKSEKYPWRYPREAFGKKDKAGNWISPPWYKSADVHNIKRQIPLKLWAIPGGVVLAGIAIWGGIHLFGGVLDRAKGGGASGKAVATAPGAGGAQVATQPGAMRAGPATVAEYLEARTPRLPSFPHTSPAYDQVTQPTEAPYPAACVRMGDKCKCYTQQATLLQTPVAVCDQIVKEGYFVDWRQREASNSQSAARPSQDAAQHDQKQSARSLPAPVPAASPVPVAPSVSQWSQGLAARNAEVRSALR